MRHPSPQPLVRIATRKNTRSAALEAHFRPRPSRIIAEQREVIAELESLVDVLKGALAASGQQEVVDYQPWMKGLTPQERALVGALYRTYPRALDKFALLDLLPGRDHVQDRNVQLVGIKVCQVRKKLGASAIEALSGLGYRLGADLYRTMKAQHDDERSLAA